MNAPIEKELSASVVVNTLMRKKTIELSENREVEIRLCKVKDVAVFVEFVTMLWEQSGINSGLEDEETLKAIVRAKLRDVSFLLKLISDKGPEVFAIVSRFSSLTLAEVGELDLDDMIVLTQNVLGLNYDFFIQRVLPLVKAAFAEFMVKRKATAKS
jgi:hypothetical protein